MGNVFTGKSGTHGAMRNESITDLQQQIKQLKDIVRELLDLVPDYEFTEPHKYLNLEEIRSTISKAKEIIGE